MHRNHREFHGLHLMVAVLMGMYAASRSHAAWPDHDKPTLTAQYRHAVERITKAVARENDAYDKLEELCLTIGHRLSGSEQLERAVQWALRRLKQDGQENVRGEKVMVPHWVRGHESAQMLKPRHETLHILGLGGSVGTGPDGLTGEVVVVADEEELEALGDRAKGKIVLFNNPMPTYHADRGAGYGKTVRFRSNGARLASEKGAIACLVRSVTSKSLRSPHTGAMRYGNAKVKIPAAAVSVEDAELMARLQERGIPITISLKMEAKTLPDAESANVIAELVGRENPEEVVVIGGHLDSWDVGQGAHDDGGGCVIAMEAINVLRKLGMVPRRTIRVVLWTNEENGLRGGRAYAKDHADELKNHVAAIELDSGVFAPRGYSIECSDKTRELLARRQMEEIIELLAPTHNGLRVTAGGSGADIGPLRDAGFILMGHRVDGKKYFDYHHTFADTIDKVDPEELSQNVAVLATVAYILADMPQRIGTAPGS